MIVSKASKCSLTPSLNYLKECLLTWPREISIWREYSCHACPVVTCLAKTVLMGVQTQIFFVLFFLRFTIEMINLLGDKDECTALHYVCKNDLVSVYIILKMLEVGGRELLIMKNWCGANAL